MTLSIRCLDTQRGRFGETARFMSDHVCHELTVGVLSLVTRPSCWPSNSDSTDICAIADHVLPKYALDHPVTRGWNVSRIDYRREMPMIGESSPTFRTLSFSRPVAELFMRHRANPGQDR